MPSSVGYLLDTNVLLALVRGKSLGEVIDSRFGLRSAINRSMICVVTAGEMLSLAHQFGWGQSKRDELQAILDEIVWIDINHPDIIDAYAEIDFASRSQGRGYAIVRDDELHGMIYFRNGDDSEFVAKKAERQRKANK